MEKTAIIPALILCVLLAGCAPSAQVPPLPHRIRQVEVSYLHNARIVTWELEPEQIDSLVSWADALETTQVRFAEGQTPADAEGSEVFSFRLNDGAVTFSYYYQTQGGWLHVNGQWYALQNDPDFPVAPSREETEPAPPPLVMVNGTLYYHTGKESAVTGRCGVMDGQISSTVDPSQIPAADGQSNFGTGYGYQYAAEDTIEVRIDGKWMVFARNGQ